MMRSYSRPLLPHVLALTVMALVLFFGSASAAFKHVDDGMKFPKLSGKDLVTGEKVSSEDLISDGAEVVVVVFWATWSTRSLDLLSDMKLLAEQYAEHPFKIIAVNVEGQRISGPTRKRIDETVKRLALPFSTLLDPDLALFKSYGVVAVPSTAILDNKHVLRSGPAGYSFVVKDAIVDSVSILLGLKSAAESDVMVRGYQPKARALRYYNTAVQLSNKGLPEKALTNVERAVAADTVFSAAHSLRGEILRRLAQAENAEQAFNRAVALDSTSVVAWAGWGRSLLELDRMDDAQKALDKALHLDPGYTPALLSLAHCRLRQGDNTAAEAHLKAALELNPRDPEILYNLGSYYRTSGRNAEAITAFRTALKQLGH